jgi:hypothetical protein
MPSYRRLSAIGQTGVDQAPETPYIDGAQCPLGHPLPSR